MKGANGFTLIEVAIAIVVLGLLLGGAVMTLSAQMDLKQQAETQQSIGLAQDAILGFAAANGRLPCPAFLNGFESPDPAAGPLASPNNCTHYDNGFVPAASLGLAPVNSSGHLIDAWGNPIRYAVTNANNNAFVTPNAVRSIFGTAALESSDKLFVCTAENCVPSNTWLTNRAVFVLFSTGKNGVVDHVENSGVPWDNQFLYATQSSTSDDLMIWVSPFTLYARMLAAGTL